MRITVIRKAHFNAAHRLFIREWSDEKNAEVFGPCANPHFHGHNYEIEVMVTGAVDPYTGMCIDLKYLSQLIKEQVEDKMDHRNLNIEVAEFKDLNPSAENICLVIWRILRDQLDASYDLHVRLWETPRNSVVYPPVII